jgi:uncharacterized membrane protein
LPKERARRLNYVIVGKRLEVQYEIAAALSLCDTIASELGQIDLKYLSLF